MKLHEKRPGNFGRFCAFGEIFEEPSPGFFWLKCAAH
jgi:hypothetical protein